MKRMILAVSFMLAMFSAQAEASTDVNVVLSSGNYSGVWVSSGAKVQIDNRVKGSTDTITSKRIGLEIQNLDTAYNIYCAYDNLFSTTTVNQAQGDLIGKRIGPGDVVFIGALRSISYYCQAENAAGGSVWIHTEWITKE